MQIPVSPSPSCLSSAAELSRVCEALLIKFRQPVLVETYLSGREFTVGIHAAEIIHVAALAINQKLTVTQLGNLIFAHPVISEAIMEAAHDLHGHSVHLAKKRS